MAQNEEILRRSLAKIETTRGTGVTPTRKVYETVRLSEAREPLEFAESTGTFDAWRTFLQGPLTVTGTVEGPASFEDLAWWLEHGVKGGVSASGDAGSPVAYTRSYQPSASTDDLASSTIEHGAPDNPYKSTMVMLPSWSLRGDIDGEAAWMLSGSLIGKTFTKENAFTSGINDRTREFIKAAGTKLYIDEPGGTIGTTQVTAKFISFSLDWNNAVNTKRFMEDEEGISSVIGRGARQITGQVRLEFDTDAEKAKFRAGTKRLIRIEREGSTIHSTVKNRVRIDIPDAYWLTPSEDTRENNMTLTFGFRAYTGTAGYPAKVDVVNTVQTF